MVGGGRHVPMVGPLSGSARLGIAHPAFYITSLQQRAHRPPMLVKGGRLNTPCYTRACRHTALSCVETCETEVGEPVVRASATHVRETVKKKAGKRCLKAHFSLVCAPHGHTGKKKCEKGRGATLRSSLNRLFEPRLGQHL